MADHVDHPEDPVVDRDPNEDEDELAADDVDEEVQDNDIAMGDTDDTNIVEEIQLQNDSAAHFDAHSDSIFCIAQHPKNPALVVTGGGDDTAYLWDSTPADTPVLPASYRSDQQSQERTSLPPIAKFQNHTDSVNAIAFTSDGEHIITAGLDGRMNVYSTTSHALIAHAQEVQEINWLAPCPYTDSPHTFALGASDGSVWVYRLEPTTNTLDVLQAYYLHTASCTAGAWTPDGKLLASVSEDSSLHVWDVFGEASAAGLASSQAVVSLDAQDERFLVDGGLYSVAISPGGAICAVGGAGGQIRVVGLPRLSAAATAGAKTKAGGAKGAASAAGQSGVILAALAAQSDGVETLAFSAPPLTLLAAGSVDGSIVLFDVAHNFAIRRHVRDAHEEEAVISVAFVQPQLGEKGENYILTSCGNDGVVRRWDARGQAKGETGQGLLKEYKGHRGGGEGGGVLGFVQRGGTIITAGDE